MPLPGPNPTIPIRRLPLQLPPVRQSPSHDILHLLTTQITGFIHGRVYPRVASPFVVSKLRDEISSRSRPTHETVFSTFRRGMKSMATGTVGKACSVVEVEEDDVGGEVV